MEETLKNQETTEQIEAKAQEKKKEKKTEATTKEILLENLKEIKEIVLKYKEKIETIRENKKLIQTISISLAGICIISAGILVCMTYQEASQLNAQVQTLLQLKEYTKAPRESNNELKQFLNNPKTIYELIKGNNTIKDETAKYTAYAEEKQVPHRFFLQYLLLPRLNIRKNPYTKAIDTDLIGIKFLEKNPYNDINLLKKRTDFFTNAGYLNEVNEINDITIGDITPTENGLFSLPIEVSFTAPSKRALLMLIDKISLTSEKETVALLEELFYTLRTNIKETRKEQISQLQQEYETTITGLDTKNINAVIGYNLQDWLENGKTILIDDALIQKTLLDVTNCQKESPEKCLYQFREKYRDIPSFAYILGTDLGKDKTEELRKLLINLPPIFSIKDFTFDKIKGGILEKENMKYSGKISLNVYGQDILEEETKEIAKKLGVLCFQDETKTLSPEIAIQETENVITKISNYMKVQTNQNSNIRELKDLLKDKTTEYQTANNYQKSIKLFEIYRMLEENGICKN